MDFTIRRIDGRNFYNLKQNMTADGGNYLTEEELAAPFRDVGLGLEIDWLHSLLFIKHGEIIKQWNPVRWDELKVSIDPFISEQVDDFLYTIFADSNTPDAEREPWVIGSLAYGGCSFQFADIDIGFGMTPASALSIRKDLSRLRIDKPEFCPANQPFAFPYKVQLQNCTIDLFPCIPNSIEHPLLGGVTWKIERSARTRKCKVIDVRFGSYAFPVLEVEGKPRFIVLCSNGFRGAIAPGELINIIVNRGIIIKETGDLEVDFIRNPWINIADANRFFCYTKDNKWL